MDEDGTDYGSFDKFDHFDLPRLCSNDPSLSDVDYRFLNEKRVRDLADALRSNSSVTTLTLRSCEMGGGEAEAMTDALRANRSITNMSLAFCSIGDAGAAALANHLVENDTLTRLNLEGNRIGEVGAAVIADALRVNRSVTMVELMGCGIGDAGAAALASALVENGILTELYLSYNDIEAAGAAAIAAALSERDKTGKHAALSVLDLSQNAIGDVGGRAMAAMLRQNRTIEALGLSRCDIGDEAAKAIAAALVVNDRTTCVDLDDNYIGDVGAKYLACATLLRVRSYQLDLSFNIGIGEEEERILGRSLHLCQNVDVDAGDVHEAVALIEGWLPAVDFLSIPTLDFSAMVARNASMLGAAPSPVPGRLAILDKAHRLITDRILEQTRPIPEAAMPLALERIGRGGGGRGSNYGDDCGIRIDALLLVCRDKADMLKHI